MVNVKISRWPGKRNRCWIFNYRRHVTFNRKCRIYQCHFTPVSTIGTPKTGRGRAIAISPALARLLARHKAEQNQQRLKLGVVYRNLGFVFAKETWEPLQMNNFGQREFAQLIEASGVKKIRFHDLRHTCATLLLARGMHPKIVQERLGHSNISMTLDRYSHVTPTMQREAAQVMGDILNIH